MTKKKRVIVVYNAGGTIETIHKDGLAKSLGAEEVTVRRATNVEWEPYSDDMARFVGERGSWTVRAAHDDRLAIRHNTSFPFKRGEDSHVFVSSDAYHPIVGFETREAALAAEVAHFGSFLKDYKFCKEGYEQHPCLPHDITGCMACRYGEGGDPPRKDGSDGPKR
jgi:hypothetical protein